MSSSAEIAFSEEEGLLAYSAYELLGKRSAPTKLTREWS